MTIFIKTYPKDFEWLKYCLRAIAKFAPQFPVVIVCDTEGKKEMDQWGLTREKVFYRPTLMEGYVDQQIVKLEAYKYVEDEYILFIDSDSIFNAPVTEEDYMKDGKPYLLKTSYDKVGDAICWKAVTEKLTGILVEFEYMRRQGMLYRRDTLINLAKHCEELHGGSYRDMAIRLVKNREMSEFNMLGAYVEKFEADKYVILDTEKDKIPEGKISQYWSWGGCNAEAKKEMEAILT